MVFLRNTMLGADDASGEAGTPPVSGTGKCARKTATFFRRDLRSRTSWRRAGHGLGASSVAAFFACTVRLRYFACRLKISLQSFRLGKLLTLGVIQTKSSKLLQELW